MNSQHEPIDEVLLSVRRAYRLLYDYQQWILDAIKYIGAKLDMNFHYGYPLMGERIINSSAMLKQSSWAWLPMSWSEFHFVKNIGNEEWYSLSFLVISDTGCIDDDAAIYDKTNTFAPSEKSSTKFAFVFRRTDWEQVKFTEERETMKAFFKDGFLPQELVTAGIYGGKCYDLSCLASPDQVEKVIDDLLDFAKEKSLPLERLRKTE
jgi:hypothetical protein